MWYVHFLFLNCAIAHVLRDSFQVEENEDYAMGAPLKSINLGVEQPKPGDVAITAAHRAKRGIFSQYLGCFGGLQIHIDLHIFPPSNRLLIKFPVVRFFSKAREYS